MLKQNDLLALSLVSKAVKNDYGGKLEHARLDYRNDISATSFFTFTRRHQNLRQLEICGLGLAPCFLASIRLGHFRQLKELILPDKNIFLNCLSTLAGLIAEGALPVLAEFKMLESQKKGAIAKIMQGFQAGGCPLLTTLKVPISFYRTFVTADGIEARVLDIGQTEQNMEALASTFEARAARGGCEGLYKSGNVWSQHVDWEVHTRLLRVLLPSIKEVPYFQWDLELARTVRDIGAPHLEFLTVPQNCLQLIERVERRRAAEDMIDIRMIF